MKPRVLPINLETPRTTEATYFRLLSLFNTHLARERWVNLWWPAEFLDDRVSGECTFFATASDLGAPVFVGNVALVVGVLLGIFLLHIAVISGVEAHWLTRVSHID